MAIALGVRTLYLENFALKTCIHDAGFVFFFSSRRRHTRFDCDWSSDVCSSDLAPTTTRARHVSRFPSPPPRATTPATARPSQRRSCTLVLSRTTAPARAAARSRMVSNVARDRAKLYAPARRPHITAPLGATTFIPYTLAWGARSTASSTPSSRPRIAVVAGLRYSEQGLWRGKRARSSSNTRAPPRESSRAVAAPAGPAPTTIASQRSLTRSARPARRPLHRTASPRDSPRRCRAIGSL